MRRQYTDCFTVAKTAQVSASATNNADVNSAHYDTEASLSPVVVIDVTSLAAQKTLVLRLQHSDNTTSSNFEDVDDDFSDKSVNVSANGVYVLGYTGEKRYIRLVVKSTTASPAAKVDCFWQSHRLLDKPNNASFKT